MPQLINQPSNRISLTNVSLVRLKKGKKRFEIACYKNKLLEYRSGLETDLDNVLQTPTIFLNVSKGQMAPKEDLQKSFGKGVSQEDIVKEILKKGEVQVGAGERKELLERVEREVVEMVAERCVDPETKRVYTTGIIRKALDLLAKQAGHTQQGLDTQKHLKDEEDGEAAPEEEQAGYIGLGKLDIKDDDADGTKPGQKIQQGKKGKKGKAGAAGAGGGGKHPHEPTAPTEDTTKGPSTLQQQPQDTTIPTWTGVSTSKPPKALALEAMKALIYHQPIPIQRARMRLRISIPASLSKHIVKTKARPHKTTDIDNNDPSPSSSKSSEHQKQPPQTLKQTILTAYIEEVESESTSTSTSASAPANPSSSSSIEPDWEVQAFVEPGLYKGLVELVAQETRGRGRVEVLDLGVVVGGEE